MDPSPPHDGRHFTTISRNVYWYGQSLAVVGVSGHLPPTWPVDRRGKRQRRETPWIKTLAGIVLFGIARGGILDALFETWSIPFVVSASRPANGGGPGRAWLPVVEWSPPIRRQTPILLPWTRNRKRTNKVYCLVVFVVGLSIAVLSTVDTCSTMAKCQCHRHKTPLACFGSC